MQLNANELEKPSIIAITMGDPAGIGPEIVAKTIAEFSNTEKDVKLFIIGDPNIMKDAAQFAGVDLNFRLISDVSEVEFNWPTIDVLRPFDDENISFAMGKLDPNMGRLAGLCLQKVAELTVEGLIDGIVSAPLNKEAFHLGGFEHRDELFLLGELTNSPEPFIGGAVMDLWTITIAEHVPFKEIISLVKKDRVLNRIRLLNNALKKGGVSHPRIGVAALNVHGGEGGQFGFEEIDEIIPAIDEAKEDGVQVEGPIPADAIFPIAFSGAYDGVVCMYHDQANIARKLQPRGSGATLFLGLPVMCATTAHGTAFDIAGKGIADHGGFATALKWVVRHAN